MAEAIETKVRRYTKALNNITGSGALTPATAGSVSSTKRPASAVAAFDEARERVSKRLRHSTSSSSLAPSIRRSPAAPRPDDSRSKDPPNFAPWSHDAFLGRLKTFSSVSLWHPKPEAISEVEWAKRGWVCVGVNTVACKGGCEKRVVVAVDVTKGVSAERLEEDEEAAEEDKNDDNEAALEQALADRYKDIIVEGHSENCLWRKAGCKDDIYHLQVVRPSIWQPDLRKRYQSALAIQTAIQNVKLKSDNVDGPTTSTPEKLLKDLPKDILSDSPDVSESVASANALNVALHGWRGSTESGSELLNCDACFQRIGLWMYQPDYQSTHAKDDDEDAEEGATLDLIELHREHCPWRNPKSQKASGSLSGLNASQILQRVVSTYAREQKRRLDEQTAQPDDPVVSREENVESPPPLSREEVAQKDKERESRLRKLKSLFTIKRRSTKVAPKTAAR